MTDMTSKESPSTVPMPTLRTAAAEALLSGALLCAEVEAARPVGRQETSRTVFGSSRRWRRFARRCRDVTTECRCGDCVAMGVECPRGYVVEILRCDVCPYAMVLTSAGCAPRSAVKCLECGGSMTEGDDGC